MAETCYGKGSIYPKLEQGKVRLYSMRFCPFSKRVRITLAAKNIPHEIINIDLGNKPEWYLEKNPSGRVPLFEQDDKMLTDSVIISEYLDDAFPDNKLCPTDPYLKAKDKLTLEEFGKILGRISEALHDKIENGEFPFFWHKPQETLKQFEKDLETRNSTFFGGCKPGLLDYLMWPWFEIVPVLYIMHPKLAVFPKSEYPLLSRWIENMKLDKAVQKVAMDPELYASFMKTYLEGSPDFNHGL